jgi:outer membrane protein assembly factor BamA
MVLESSGSFFSYKSFSYWCCLFCLLCCLSVGAAAQSVHLSIAPIDASPAFVSDTLHLKTLFANALQCREYVQQLPGSLQAQGYLAASVDSSREQKDSMQVTLFIGKKYTWESIAVKEKDKPLLTQLGIKENWFKAKPINVVEVNTVENKLLDYFLTNGFPFATIGFDSVQIHGNTVYAQLNIRKGIPYKLDSIRIIGNEKLDIGFLYHYLGMTPGSLFSIDKLNKINQLLQQLPYLQQNKEWTLTMLASTYLLNLYLQPKKSNQLNAIAGFAPANGQTGGKLLLTGSADLSLKNSFGAGESIGLNWQQLQAASPRLNLSFLKPYIFNTPYGLDLGFDLYKKDSTYLNLTTKFGFQYLNTPTQTGTISMQFFSTNLLNVDTLSVIADKQLPDIADVRNTSIVWEHKVDVTNYHPNPTSGSLFEISVAAGNKKIKKNGTILQIADTSFNYASLYDTVQLNTYQFKIRGGFAHYFPVGRQAVIKAAATGGWYQSPNYYLNELFQIGGYKLLRGFDEESIYADRFTVFTAEYRYLLGINSYLNGFTDVGLTHNSVSGINNNFIGGGVGLAFESKQGIMNINIAVGKRNDLPFSFNEAKIHIGFVSLF